MDPQEQSNLLRLYYLALHLRHIGCIIKLFGTNFTVVMHLNILVSQIIWKTLANNNISIFVKPERGIMRMNAYFKKNIAQFYNFSLISLHAYTPIFHYKNTPMQYTAIFHGCKNDNFQIHFRKIVIFFLFLLKHRLRVHVRTTSLRRF